MEITREMITNGSYSKRHGLPQAQGPVLGDEVFDKEVPAFRYRSLEDMRLGIRFFKLFPGDFDEPVVGELIHGIFDAGEDGFCQVFPLPARNATTSLRSRIG